MKAKVSMFKRISFEVVGEQRIACDGCEERIETLLNEMPGVGKVQVRARNQRIDLLFDAAALDSAAIAERLREAGYETRLAG
jgi:copper chaperone